MQFLAVITLAAAAQAAVLGTAPAGGYTTSVVTDTVEVTITQCATTVTNCPAHSTIKTVITTEYTTICPVTATETGAVSTPAAPSSSAAPVVSSTSAP
jgi:hypothetical protein